MKLLCLTSMSWIRNIVKAFKMKKNTFGILTSISTVASINLWRNYQYMSMRRTFDVFIARCLGIYYIKYGFLDSRLNTCNRFLSFSVTGVCYLLSKHGFKPRISHFLFHVNVYNIQRIMLLK